jgi:uncharacterized protein YjbI with pentapeptide repeats
MQGVDAWNGWRATNAQLRPDFNSARLIGVKLAGADLSRADFRQADLNNAELGRANLSESDLREANLSWANLRGAYSYKADYSGAKLTGAYFIDADLSRAKFIECDMSKAHLRGAYMVEAQLIRANLSGAALNGANFRKASLTGADLRESDLSGALLDETDMSGADLSRADLGRTVFRGANLANADFSGAEIGWATFARVDLSGVKGLTDMKHRGPSTVGIDTVYLSHGSIPATFLKGVGAPDTFIDFAATAVGQAIQYYSCFISYASNDRVFVERLHADLQKKGVRCWYAPDDMAIGAKIRVDIDESIKKQDKLLLVLSRESVTSDWVEQEVETALARERQERRSVLFPIRLDNAVMELGTGWPALIKNTRHIGDFTRWKDPGSYQEGIERLVPDLQMEAQK